MCCLSASGAYKNIKMERPYDKLVKWINNHYEDKRIPLSIKSERYSSFGRIGLIDLLIT